MFERLVSDNIVSIYGIYCMKIITLLSLFTSIFSLSSMAADGDWKMGPSAGAEEPVCGKRKYNPQANEKSSEKLPVSKRAREAAERKQRFDHMLFECGIIEPEQCDLVDYEWNDYQNWIDQEGARREERKLLLTLQADDMQVVLFGDPHFDILERRQASAHARVTLAAAPSRPEKPILYPHGRRFPPVRLVRPLDPLLLPLAGTTLVDDEARLREAAERPSILEAMCKRAAKYTRRLSSATQPKWTTFSPETGKSKFPDYVAVEPQAFLPAGPEGDVRVSIDTFESSKDEMESGGDHSSVQAETEIPLDILAREIAEKIFRAGGSIDIEDVRMSMRQSWSEKKEIEWSREDFEIVLERGYAIACRS